MEATNKEVIFTRPHKTIYAAGRRIIKVFDERYTKADVLNEARNEALVEENTILNSLRHKLMDQINSLKDLDATARYELATRLESMPRHTKLCHGDFNPSNVIMDKRSRLWIIDWAHAAQGNASADAAMTFL